MSITSLRKRIDALDKKIVALLCDRAEISLLIGQEKVRNKKGIYSPGREKQVLQHVASLNKGPVSTEALEAIYHEIMSSSLSLEKIKDVAYLGTQGSFTHSAALKKFGSQIDYQPCTTILEVFQKVERGDCDYGVVPIENSTEGAVTHTLDMFVDSDLKICAQILCPISHNLLSKTSLAKIRKIYSNPQVFGQCRNWLLEHLPHAGKIWVDSTTLAAGMAVKEKNSAAIASALAAKVYKLPILHRNIQDIANNTTRFLVIGTQETPPTGSDRTSILFSIKDKVGALYAMLTPFYKNWINLTKIESRPSKKRAWDYYFFVDFEGHRLDRNVKKALSKLEDMCKYLKILGSYPV
ncbi:MAG: prephenate dehydratase [Omnitrophica WOR_2 bacterium RIFCSPHIGHO2_01_FULL_48_9]|nr:MAG: prephenate dehydratase [Omnitrophica WOR_2 bacterium RIFCSPHIGHO2_02_FULL_48_11]OGX32058.1 MAG: prephenate dehydratase [Omnitrophica WOR_2 bacterium RIFCSPHIGHO2_01_FULL_48_9]